MHAIHCQAAMTGTVEAFADPAPEPDPGAGLFPRRNLALAGRQAAASGA
jgi:hypothetical protein